MTRPGGQIFNAKIICRSLRAQRRWLSIHEHQAQALLSEYKVPVPSGLLARSTTEVKEQISRFGGQGVVKAQILAGGRGKGSFVNGYSGGVHMVSSPEEGERVASQMLGQSLVTKQTLPEGLPVDKLFVVEKLNVGQEYYLAITIDRRLSCPVLILSRGGGTNIEQLAITDPSAVIKIPLTYSEGITNEIIASICQRFGLEGTQPGLRQALRGLYRFFKERDATLVEINPLVQSADTREWICADSKVSIDNAAAKRQGEVFALRDRSQEAAIELEAEEYGLVYVQLEGNIGCLVNGAGLAMATNDAVAHYGGKCANFLDGGGQATKETMVKAFELILSDKRVNTILVNIYGGIIRCDMIAESIIAAAENFKDVPMVVRLQGTNSAEGQQMIAKSGLKLFAEDDFGDAVRKAIDLAARSPGLESASGTTTQTFKSPAARSFSTTARPSIAKVGFQRADKRTFSTTFTQRSYVETGSSLLIGPHTRVIYQGFTGKAATSNAQETLAYGTNIVGGVSPTATSSTHLSLPLYTSIQTAAKELEPDATAVFVPAHSAATAITQAIEAEIPLIVSVAEHIPLHDMLRVQEILRTQSKSRLVGPNCPGIIAPPAGCRIGIMPHRQYMPGVVGIASKSGTLSYEAVGATTRAGLGQSLCIGVGGDMLPGTTLLDAVKVLLKDPHTRGIILIGEIGGDSEIEVASFLSEQRQRNKGNMKPVVGMVTGRTAPKGRTMGHAGAIAGGGPSAEEKVRALEAAGVKMAVHPGELGGLMRGLLEAEGVDVGESKREFGLAAGRG